MKNNLLLTIVSFIALSSSAAGMTSKRAEDVFKKWLSWQQIMPERNVASMTDHLNDNFLVSFRQQYEKTAPALEPLTPFLNTLTASHINQHGYFLRTPISEPLVANLSGLYHLVQNDMNGFIDFLKHSNFLPTKKTYPEIIVNWSDDTIDQYTALFDLLFAHPQEQARSEYLFSVANQFYEHCFAPESFNDFERNLLDKESHPIAQMLYTVTWLNLAGNGWKHWHENSLATLKDRADNGHQIVYIAGGSDIYQLIKAGIYNIKNIDPQLPSQPKYYTDEWQFIASGKIGDTIMFSFDNRTITMQRVGFQMPGTTFKARIASGEIIEIPHSTTTWQLTDEQGKVLGQYILDRRFCQQADFASTPNKTLLISFNELYFVCLPDILHGWHIEPSQFDTNFSIVVKQLRKPVSKQMAVNMRIASMLNATDFKFIALGTCIN